MLANRLAQIHSQFGVYASPLVDQRVDLNILDAISDEPQLQYLVDFYDEYLGFYKKASSNSESAPNLTGDARSTDLPFLGPEVMQTGKAKYMFVFVGSLQAPTILSVTVLSCYWLLEKPDDVLMRRFWPKLATYYRLVKKLGITPGIARTSYVTDIFRIGNQNKKPDTRGNRALVFEEIDLLSPELVVLVGSRPRDIVGKNRIDQDKRMVHVPFPADGVPKITQERAPIQYQELRRRLREMEASVNNS